MTSCTAPQEFLRDLADVNSLVHDLIASPRHSMWHWPSYYLMYVDLDRLAVLLTQVGHLFDPPFSGMDEPPPVDEFVEGANDLFASVRKRQKAVVQWLWQLSRFMPARGADPVRRARLSAHVHPKSGWYQTFMQAYSCGSVSADGRTLTRTVLPTDPGASSERLNAIDAECMLRHQTFDIATPEARLALAHAAQDARDELGKLLSAMYKDLAQNCRIEDLLHPSSL